MECNVEKKKKYTKSIIFMIIMMIATFYVLLRGKDLENLMQIFRQVDFIYIALGMAMVLFLLFCQGMSYKTILRAFYVKISYFKCFTYACIDFHYSSITPSGSGGEPMLGYSMSKDDISVSTTTMTLLINAVAYKVVLIFFGILTVFFLPGTVFRNGGLLIVLFSVGVTINIISISVCLLSIFSKGLFPKIAAFIIKLLRKTGLFRKRKRNFLSHMVKEYRSSAVLIRNNPVVLLKSMFFCFFQRAAMFSISYCVYRSFGLNEKTIFHIMAIQIVLSLSVDSLPIPGGMGVTEATFLMLYSSIYHGDLILAAVLITRGLNYYFCLLVSSTFSMLHHFKGITNIRDKVKESVT